MNRDDIRKLLGGYGTGTLTPEEQQALFAAALDDQELFDTLAREQSLRDLLRDPAAKAQLLSALDERPRPWYERIGGWKPTVAAAALAAIVIAVLVVHPGRQTAGHIELAQATIPDRVEKAVQPPAAALEPSPQQSEVRPRTADASRPVKQEQRSAAPTRPVVAPSQPAASPAAARPADKVEVSAAAPAPPPVRATETRSEPTPANAATVQAASGNAVQPGQPFAGGVNVPAGQLAGARDLYYSNVSGFLPKEAESDAAKKSAQGRARAAASAGQVAFSSPPGVIRTALSAPPANLGVKYTVLRKTEAGDFAEINPENLRSGDAVAIRFEPNDSGYLLVQSRHDGVLRQIFSSRVERRTPYTTPLLRSEDRELLVTFSRQGEPAAASSVIRTQEAALERATYVVSDPGSAPVRFTIKLDYR